MKTRLLTLTAVLAASAAAAQTSATSGFEPGAAGMPGILAKLGELNLSETQRQQIREIVQARRDATKPLADAAEAERKKLRDAFVKNPANETVLRSHSEQVALRHTELLLAAARTWTEVRRVLTPEQLGKVETLAAESQGLRARIREAIMGGRR